MVLTAEKSIVKSIKADTALSYNLQATISITSISCQP